MLETIGYIIGAGAVAAGALLGVIKLLLPGAMNVLVKRIEHTQNRELTQLEARLQAHTTSVVHSVDIASRIHARYRDKTIESVERLWKDILHKERTFASLAAVVSILTKKELLDAIRKPDRLGRQVREALTEFEPEGKIEEVFSSQVENGYSASDVSIGLGTFPSHLHDTRPFVSESTYGLYQIITSVHARLAILVRFGIESGDPVYWADDPTMVGFASAPLSKGKWEEIKKLEVSGFRTLVQELNRLFIQEVKNDIRGTGALAESVTEVGQIFRDEESRSRWDKGWN